MAERKSIDCREHPSVNNCSGEISGSEEEVLKIAVRRAVEEHDVAPTIITSRVLAETTFT